MESKTVTVPNISCEHCTNTIEMEVGDIAGVNNVEADVDSKEVTIAYEDPATWEEIESLLVEINFPPSS